MSEKLETLKAAITELREILIQDKLPNAFPELFNKITAADWQMQQMSLADFQPLLIEDNLSFYQFSENDYALLKDGKALARGPDPKKLLGSYLLHQFKATEAYQLKMLTQQ